MKLPVVVAVVLALLVTGRAAEYGEPLRPGFHFTPARNFMNDPNGLVYYKGEYHLFYQHNPFGEKWGHMSWGHAVSSDMLHWQHLPVAIPEAGGVMIFSGSAVVDWHNSSGLCQPHGHDPSCLVAIYTSQEKEKETQSIAYSQDRGRTWTKYAGNPVIDPNLKNFRDPKVFWHEATRRWVMVTVLADRHKVRFYGSPDLKKWDVLSEFGPAGATGGVWECPDLFPLPVDNDAGKTRWVLDVNLNPGGIAGGSGDQYFIGSFDGTRFTNDNPPDRTLWADYGKDFYASSSFADVPAADGRRIWLGWISNWLYANDEPTVVWRGAQSIPRALALRRFSDGVRLMQSPVAELNRLHASPQPTIVSRESALPPCAEIEMEMTPGDWRQAAIQLSNSAGEEVTVGVISTPPEVFIDRRKSRATAAFHDGYAGRHAGPVAWRNGKITLRVFFDRSVVEVFANDGETVITERVYPTAPLDRLHLLTDGAAAPAARMWTLETVWPKR